MRYAHKFVHWKWNFGLGIPFYFANRITDPTVAHAA
jgi:hypothetical protein